jgi:hypothetical protein
MRKTKEAEEQGLEQLRKTRKRKYEDKELAGHKQPITGMWRWLRRQPMRPLN